MHYDTMCYESCFPPFYSVLVLFSVYNSQLAGEGVVEGQKRVGKGGGEGVGEGREGEEEKGGGGGKKT